MEIKLCNDNLSDIWDKSVLSSEYGTIFHKWNFLRIAEKYSGSSLLGLMIYQGTELKAIYPVFLKNRSAFNIAMSPVSRSFMYYLGPLFVDYENLKQRKKETRFINVQQIVDELLFSELGCRYARIRLVPGYYDSRPLSWSGYDVKPLYTTRIDLKRDIDDIWNDFDKRIKGTIKKADSNGIQVNLGDLEDMRYIFQSLSERLKDQNLRPSGNWEFIYEIYNEYNNKNLNVFIAKENKKRIGGIISLYFKGIFFLWIGTLKNPGCSISPNELLVWESLKWAKEHGLKYFENMDSGSDPRLRFFKSKFNPEPVIWHSAEKYSPKYLKYLGQVYNKTN
ncbi:GNAT family N-acetyltransferase [Methanoplanus limicola]|uniref:BioF2-like acetyltransferase domain-containing protein n=1 Tax=Methanoplanus limicola DSM 2279 TaxID=937775 RepID=H1YZR2_9EURY|nr:GNAT family N-acetyltransferase [Methanoplanus limicola]EHQ34324.1 hypothetical protein Metlim_0171 [Methanoplanus limicola DSM 2279]